MKAFALAFAAALMSVNAPAADERPDYNEMRAYWISQMTDNQIRVMYSLANDDYIAVIQARATAYSRAKAEFEKCKDVAFKARNPTTCASPPRYVRLEDGPEVAVEQYFEKRLMKWCAPLQTKQAAIQQGCLPDR